MKVLIALLALNALLPDVHAQTPLGGGAQMHSYDNAITHGFGIRAGTLNADSSRYTHFAVQYQFRAEQERDWSFRYSAITAPISLGFSGAYGGPVPWLSVPLLLESGFKSNSGHLRLYGFVGGEWMHFVNKTPYPEKDVVFFLLGVGLKIYNVDVKTIGGLTAVGGQFHFSAIWVLNKD